MTDMPGAGSGNRRTAGTVQADLGRISTRNAWALLLLMLAFVLNYVDRQILGILAVKIKGELSLSDTQLGLIGGLSFAILYSIAALPMARLADRKSRVKIIAIACGAWSLFTVLCGFVHSFWQLFLARMGVGIGEAAGMAPAMSLVTDLFPLHQRARAIAIFDLGIPIGSALGIFFGGWIAASIDWRVAFMLAGIVGFPLAVAIRLVIKEPVRGGHDGYAVKPGPQESISVVARKLLETPSFWYFAVASAFSSIPLFGVMFWMPSFLQRSYGLSLIDVSTFYGSIILVGGLAGIWSGGWLSDRFGTSDRRAYAVIPATTLLLAAPLFIIAMFTQNMAIAFILFVTAQVLHMIAVPAQITAVQHIVPPSMRTTATAAYQFITTMIGMGFGTFLLGAMSDHFNAEYGVGALRYSILCGLSFYLPAGVLLILAARHVRRDWGRGHEVPTQTA
jgi:MFS family permease